MQESSSPSHQPQESPNLPLGKKYYEYEEYIDISSSMRKEDKQNNNHEKIEDEKELRILEFLSNEGIHFRTPWEKMFDYLEKTKKTKQIINECDSIQNTIASTEYISKEEKFKLNSGLYLKRMKTKKSEDA